jgi:D-serine deaminase-like pyridoxal phosphate-dependent protein
MSATERGQAATGEPDRGQAATGEPDRGQAATGEPDRGQAATGERDRGRFATSDLERLEAATADLDPPFAVVDLDAFWANAVDMERRAAPKPIRLASKSVRCRSLQQRVLARPGFAGTLAFTLPEALWLADAGFENLVVAYPTVDRRALAALPGLAAERPRARVALMVDDVHQLDLIEAAIGAAPRKAAGGADAAPPGGVRVCIDLDAGLRLFAGRIQIGAKRSPLHTPADAAALARQIVARGRFELVGMMAYEAQIAGLGDAPRRV